MSTVSYNFEVKIEVTYDCHVYTVCNYKCINQHPNWHLLASFQNKQCNYAFSSSKYNYENLPAVLERKYGFVGAFPPHLQAIKCGIENPQWTGWDHPDCDDS